MNDKLSQKSAMAVKQALDERQTFEKSPLSVTQALDERQTFEKSPLSVTQARKIDKGYFSKRI